MILQDIFFKNFDGTSNAHYDPIVGTLVCSSAEVRRAAAQTMICTDNNVRGALTLMPKMSTSRRQAESQHNGHVKM